VRSHRISLYPDANQKVVFFSVRGEEGKVYQLYVFDIDGRLVKQVETRNKQTSVVKGIKKGSYFFEVFSDDKRIGNGQIAIR
jgi:esterase/lipase superfamily enzyme